MSGARQREHNERQIDNYIFGRELSQKGTAPSYLNLEADKEKPGPTSPMSAKGYDQVDALVRHDDPAESLRRLLSSRKAAYALDHVRRTDGRLWRAVLRAWADPGAVQRAKNSADPREREFLSRYRDAVAEAARFVEEVWPLTRLYVPLAAEEPADGLAHARKLDTARADREIVEALEKIEREEGPMLRMTAMALLAARSEKTGRPVGVDRIRRAIQRENARRGEGAA